MKAIAAAFKWLFGGSLGYVQGAIIVGLVGFVGFHWIRYHDALEDRERLRGKVAILELEAAWQDTVLASAINRQGRRTSEQSQQLNLEDRINAAPKSNDCALSPAMRISLDGLRDRRGTDAPDPE
jgi:predicted membrane-bound spermidine synthase